MNAAGTSVLTPFLERQGFVLLDGGLATELQRAGHDLDDKLWSAGVLLNHPDAIKAVHRAYLDAGADCIITSSYQASIRGFEEAGVPKQRAVELLNTSVDLALAAREQFLVENAGRAKPVPLVAASIGPYGAYLADGSEYHGNYGVDKNTLHDYHAPRWEILAGSGADLLAIETIPSRGEAEVLKELLCTTPDTTAWICFSCRDGERISDGTPIKECAELFRDCEQLAGIGVNCTAPEYLPSLIDQLADAGRDLPIIVYPNSGERYDVDQKCWREGAQAVSFALAAKDWHAHGARVIGGCCRTTPRTIREISQALRAHEQRNA